MTQEPAPLDGTVPDFLHEIFQRSVVKDPAARYPTAAAMRRALETVIVEMRPPVDEQ